MNIYSSLEVDAAPMWPVWASLGVFIFVVFYAAFLFFKNKRFKAKKSMPAANSTFSFVLDVLTLFCDTFNVDAKSTAHQIEKCVNEIVSCPAAEFNWSFVGSRNCKLTLHFQLFEAATTKRDGKYTEVENPYVYVKIENRGKKFQKTVNPLSEDAKKGFVRDFFRFVVNS